MVEELTAEQREEQVREETRLLDSLKRKLTSSKGRDDLREKLECKKIKMLDSRSEMVKTEAREGEPRLVCPLCPQLSGSDAELMDHMKRSHRAEMFGCSVCAGGLQPALAWSVEVLLQHLASQHNLNVSIYEALKRIANMKNVHVVLC